MYEHRYSVTTCPDCNADLTAQDSIEMQYNPVGNTQTCWTQLDSNGLLEDQDDVIKNGYHSGTSCKNCGCELSEYEIIDSEAAKSEAPVACPYCLSKNIVKTPIKVFVELGEHIESRFEEEGDSTRYECSDCRKGFIPW